MSRLKFILFANVRYVKSIIDNNEKNILMDSDRIIQSNLVNSKSSGLEVLFRIITSFNYKEVDKNT